jgi:hypothetical protein
MNHAWKCNLFKMKNQRNDGWVVEMIHDGLDMNMKN